MSSRRGRSGGCRRRSSREREGGGAGAGASEVWSTNPREGSWRGSQAEETRGKEEEEKEEEEEGTGESEGEEEKLVLSLVQCY